MELGMDSVDFGTYAAISILFSLCIIYPPQEFQSAGVTIPKVFHFLLGDERFDFVLHHLRRSCLTILIHSSLPLCFCLLLAFLAPEQIFSSHPHNFVQCLSALSLLIMLTAVAAIFLMSTQNWSRHYIVANLRQFNATNWHQVADDINEQMRAPLVYSIQYNAYSRVVVTANWIMRISNYSVEFARVEDTKLLVVNSNRHPLLSDENNGLQMIDIRVESISRSFRPFYIRVHSQEMLDTLRDQLGRPIEVDESLTVPQPLHDRFVDEFIKIVEGDNPPVTHRSDQAPPDSCLGCSSQPANVKLVKRCVNNAFMDPTEPQCRSCQCRPMWCARCMGRIFASKQDQRVPEIWMSGRAPCPTCRAHFCVLDVCLLEKTGGENDSGH